MGTR